MLCPICQQDVPDSSATCPACSATIASRIAAPQQTPASAPVLTPEPELARWQSVIFIILTVVFIIAMLLLNFGRAMNWAGTMNAESFGYMLGGCIFSFALGALPPFVVGKIRRKKLRRPAKWCLAMATAFLLSVLASVGEMGQDAISRQARLDQQMKNTLQQALGKAPLDAENEWWGQPARELYAGIKQFNDEYTGQMAALDQHEIHQIYTTQSYSTRADIKETLKELQSIEELDLKYASLDPLFDKMRQRIWAADVSNRQKDEFLARFNNSIRTTLAPRDASFAKAREWVHISSNLYEFMLAKKSGYTVRDGKLVFQSGQVLSQFRDKQSQAIASLRALKDAQKNVNTVQKDTLQKYGLSPSDFSSKPNPSSPPPQSK